MGGLPWLKTGSATPSATRPAGGATTPPVPPVINAPAHPVTQDHPLTIVKLTASNVKRLRAVTIAPDGNLVVLSGRNGQGKTTVLDCIEYAIGGKDVICAEPVRRGEDAAVKACAAVSLWTLGESLGGVESLIEHPGRMTHASVVGTALEVPGDLIRLSVGIEDVEDLIDDLREALDIHG